MSQSLSNQNLISKVSCLPEQTKWIIIRAENSEELHIAFLEYVNNLEQLSKMANAPSLCILCFCFLSNSQKLLHECFLSNKDNIKTPTKYCSAANLELLAKLNQNYKKEGGYEMLKFIKSKPLEAKQKSKTTVAEINSNIEKKRTTVKKKVYPDQPKEESANDIESFIKLEEEFEDEGEDLREFILKNKEKIANANKIITKASQDHNAISKDAKPKQKKESSSPDKMDQILTVLDAIKLNQDNYTIRLGKIEETHEVHLLNRSPFINI